MSSGRLDELDYYTLLGVESGVSGDRLKEAFHTFARKFHPDRHSTGPTEKVERAAEIYRRGAEAYRVLGDPELRRLYDEGLASGKLRLEQHSAEQQGARRSRVPGTVTTRAPKAIPFLSKGLQALGAGDFKNARLNLRIAASHDPDNVALKEVLAQVEAEFVKK